MHSRLYVTLWEPRASLALLSLTPLSCTPSRFILRESGFPRYLHSAVLLSGTLLVFGGNTHNDTSLSNGAKCFSADFLAYDIGRSPIVVGQSFIYLCIYLN